jgi:hypothetical protein
VPGCLSDADCAAGDACNACTRSCEPSGNTAAHIGDSCQANSDCNTGGWCLIDGTYVGGYCTQLCDSCACPSGSICGLNLSVCLRQCHSSTDCRDPYVCQPYSTPDALAHVCLPHCADDTDCAHIAPGTVCDLSSGACVAPTPDAGGSGGGTGTGGTGGGAADAGLSDGGGGEGHHDGLDAGSIGMVMGVSSGSSAGGTMNGPSGGGCSEAGGSELSILALFWLGCLAAWRRRRARSE